MRWATIVERVLLGLDVMLMGVEGVIVFFDFLKPRVRRESFFEEFHILINFIVRQFYHKDLDSGVQLSDGRK